ncbi:hypothetical protein IPJ72_02905 [Candidatus Peregrinibacteria bacterium]|nr:MAG: hypothetical protein IPJ72_02905 [Candidatus Peregrinibacteria bacterium]
MRLNRLARFLSAFLIFSGLLILPGFGFANATDDLLDERDRAQNELSDVSTNSERDQLIATLSLLDRQISISQNFDQLKNRVQSLSGRDPRKDSANALLDSVEQAVDAFITLSARGSLQKINLKSTPAFDELEKAATGSLSTLNQFLLSPYRPGATVNDQGQLVGGVPTGTLLDDFIPQLIRLLFQFVSAAVLIAFLVSGVFFIISIGNEERVTKARQMLYFSLIGFAFVVLAFAIVKAVTSIDFFTFI